MNVRYSFKVLILILLFALVVVIPSFAQVTIFSTGYYVPENIVLAPESFGTHGGEYFINDTHQDNAALAKIYTVPITGGTPAVFASDLPGSPVGALFLPLTGWGSFSGQYLTLGENSAAGSIGQIFTYDSNGNRTTFFTSSSTAWFAQAVIAPSTFGVNAGKLIVADSYNGIYAFDSSANETSIMGTNGLTPFSVAFAPADFGAFGGSLFTEDAYGGVINSMDANGTITQFARVPLKPGQIGLRQITFTPPGFLPGTTGPLLMVSVSGSQQGRGTLGDVLIYDQNGNELASMRQNLGLAKFDPRGAYFPSTGGVLVNDASDPILFLSPNDFAPPVPEPGVLALLLASSIAGGGLLIRRRAK